MKESIPCKCGCGNLTKPGNVYIFGHFWKNRILPIEIKLKISKTKTGKKLTEEHKKKISDSGKDKHKGPSTKEWKENISKGKIKQWETASEEQRLVWSNAIKEAAHNRKGKTFEELVGPEKAKEWKEKQSINNNGRHFKNLGFDGRYGLTRSKEIKNKISESNKGKVRSLEARQKSRDAQVGINYEEKYGTELAEEIKNKIRNKQIGITYEEKFGEVRAKEIKLKQRLSHEKSEKNYSKPSKLELKFKEILKNLNIEFTEQAKLPGTPDFFIEPNICIFIDGCWYHACPEHWPDGNPKRAKDLDFNNTKRLTEEGYLVLRFWEHDLDMIEVVITKIKTFLNHKMDDSKTIEKLIDEYLELDKKKSFIETDLGLIKSDIKEMLESKGIKRYYSDSGEVRIINRIHKTLSPEKVKAYMTEEQIKNCTKETPVSYCSIVSTETAELQRSFIKKD